MNENVINLLKDKPIYIPKLLFNNYSKLNITEEELIILIYLLNIDTKIIYNPKLISEELNQDKFKIMQVLNSLNEKNIISIKTEKNDLNKKEEYIYLDLLYNKLFNIIIDKNEEEKEVDTKDIFSLFESELGRTLSAMECEIIKGWLNDNIEEVLLKEALKEAVDNDAKSLKYIDRILYTWKQKGIKTKEDIIKDKRNFRNSKKAKEVFDYNWLEEEDNE